MRFFQENDASDIYVATLELHLSLIQQQGPGSGSSVQNNKFIKLLNMFNYFSMPPMAHCDLCTPSMLMEECSGFSDA